MQNDGTMIELCLAYIYVAATVTTISQANIEDMRASSSCGWVTGLVKQVDTSQLFLQWQTAYQEYYNSMTSQFNEWLDTLTQKLNVNTYIKQFHKRVVLSGGSSSNIIPMDMEGYTFASDDVISIYINGLYAAPEVDYIIDLRGSVPQLHPNASAAGTEIYIVVLKSKIGFNTLVGSDGEAVIGSDGDNISG
jgi:hypothetical protein